MNCIVYFLTTIMDKSQTNIVHTEIFLFIGKLDIFPLMCATDIVWITDLDLLRYK